MKKFVLLMMIGLFGFIFTSCDRISHKADKEYTVLEVVSQRKAEIEKRDMLDVYYSIPEPIFIQILNKLGTKTAKADVVFEYNSNYTYYDGLLDGVNKKEELTPDDLPIPPIPDKPLKLITEEREII